MVDKINGWGNLYRAVSFQHGMKLFKFMTSILAVFTANVLQFWMKENVIYFMYFLYSWLEQVIAIKEDITSYNSQTEHQDKKNLPEMQLK